MNIVQALDAALPDLPERALRRDLPRLDPRIITAEHLEHDRPVIIAKVPGTELVLRFSPEQWKLISLFDGKHTYEEIADLSPARTGMQFAPDDVREIAGFLYDNTDFLYKTPLERNIVMRQQLQGDRRKKRKRFQVPDFTDVIVAEWPNADRYISWLYPKLKFIFTPWFVWLSLFSFLVMLWMWADKFAEIWNDSFQFYNFTSKSGTDLLEFWILFAGMAFFHETAHGLTCKHFGGNVEKMGFTLMYFAPSFFCDASQVWIYGGKWERIATAIAGIWIDLIICAIATFIWWGTATGMFIHEVAYKVMMVTGIGVSLLNLNPLIKLDGYLIFCELIHEPDLKEKATAYASGMLRRYVFHLPVEIEYVQKRRRAFYVIYAILSGIYGYLLLSFLMVLTYNILHSYSPDWAFLPSMAIGYWVFKSRIKMLVRFMKIVYLDKKERARAWLTASRLATISVAALLVLLSPIFPDFVSGPFVFEPTRKAIVRAEVAGAVADVQVREGQLVSAGQPLLQLTNLNLESAAAKANADLHLATNLSYQAMLTHGNYGAAEYKRQGMTEQARAINAEISQLRISSPIRGVVVTPRVEDLVGSYFEAGTPVLEIADPSTLTARIYIPEFAMKEVRLGAEIRLQPHSRVTTVPGVLSTVSPAPSEIEPGLIPKDQLKGIIAPRFYVGSVFVANPTGELKGGMTGDAKIFVARRSLTGLAWIFTRNIVARRLW
ncbi:MAG TPA: HlyD family efflux transporter periplasmic adaptor subunit [Terriglobales bacterium]